MGLFEDLQAVLPELTIEDLHPIRGSIALRDDSDGQGVYIEKWDYKEPIPAGFKVGKD